MFGPVAATVAGGICTLTVALVGYTSSPKLRQANDLSVVEEATGPAGRAWIDLRRCRGDSLGAHRSKGGNMTIVAQIGSYAGELASLRHDLPPIPELGFGDPHRGDRNRSSGLGTQTHTAGIGGTGVVGLVKGKG